MILAMFLKKKFLISSWDAGSFFKPLKKFKSFSLIILANIQRFWIVRSY